MPTATIAHGGADGLGQIVNVVQQVHNVAALQVGVVRQRSVDVGHIGGVMSIVVQAHSGLVDMRLKRLVIVGQRRQCEVATGLRGQGRVERGKRARRHASKRRGSPGREQSRSTADAERA